MKKKIKISLELVYLLATFIMALGVSCVSRSDFGYSVITAPVFLLWQKVSQYLTWFSFGTSEYLFQGLVLLLMCLGIRKFRLPYLFTFVYAVSYGFVLDGAMWLIGLIPCNGLLGKGIFFAVGTLLISCAVALYLRTYLPLAAYELCVREVSLRYHFPQGIVKWVYDGISFVIALILSFVFFGKLEGIGIGTILSLLVNAPLITLIGKLFDRAFDPYVSWHKVEAFFKGDTDNNLC